MRGQAKVRALSILGRLLQLLTGTTRVANSKNVAAQPLRDQASAVRPQNSSRSSADDVPSRLRAWPHQQWRVRMAFRRGERSVVPRPRFIVPRGAPAQGAARGRTAELERLRSRARRRPLVRGRRRNACGEKGEGRCNEARARARILARHAGKAVGNSGKRERARRLREAESKVLVAQTSQFLRSPLRTEGKLRCAPVCATRQSALTDLEVWISFKRMTHCSFESHAMLVTRTSRRRAFS